MSTKTKQLLDAFSSIYSHQEFSGSPVMAQDDPFSGSAIQLSDEELESVMLAEMEARCISTRRNPLFLFPSMTERKDH